MIIYKEMVCEEHKIGYNMEYNLTLWFKSVEANLVLQIVILNVIHNDEAVIHFSFQ